MQALNLGSVTVRNTSYDWEGAATSQSGANGHTYLALGSGPEGDMTRDITDVAVINQVLSAEFRQILTDLGLTILHLECYKIPANYDGIPANVQDATDGAGILEQWGGDNLVTGCYDVTGKTAIPGEGGCSVYVDSDAENYGSENWKHVSELTATCQVTDSTPTVLEFEKPVNSANGSGATGWAVLVFLDDMHSVADYQTTFADYLPA